MGRGQVGRHRECWRTGWEGNQLVRSQGTARSYFAQTHLFPVPFNLYPVPYMTSTLSPANLYPANLYPVPYMTSTLYPANLYPVPSITCTLYPASL